MKRKKKEFKIELSRRLRKAYDRMRLLSGVESADLHALIDTWEHLEAEIQKDNRKQAARQHVYIDTSAGHGAYRARGGLDLP